MLTEGCINISHESQFNIGTSDWVYSNLSTDLITYLSKMTLWSILMFLAKLSRKPSKSCFSTSKINLNPTANDFY